MELWSKKPSMRITCSYRGARKIWETPEAEVVFGRADDESPVLLDLSPDPAVSRLHGRIWQADNACWIEDLNSSRGTFLNGNEIKGRGKQPLRSGDTILVGQTKLRVDFGEKLESLQTHSLERGALLLPERRHSESGIVVTKTVDATAVDSTPFDVIENVTARRLKMVCDLPFQFATKTTAELLLPAIVEQLFEIIPTVESAALVLRDQHVDVLVLEASRHIQRPYWSETLLRRSMAERNALIWNRRTQPDNSGSVGRASLEAGMYAPLLWKGEALGAVCIATRTGKVLFTDEDTRLLVLVGQYAAMAIATNRLQEKLRREAVIKANLLRQFSPKVADQLLTHRGHLRLGGRRGDVTILNSDIRGFSQLAKEMEPDQVVELLNAYLGVLVPVVFAHNGTIDKFMGDAILAVFGSPGFDPKHHENAVRAAVEMQTAVTRLNRSRDLQGAPRCDFGIGLHCGEVVHGFVGTADRMEFTLVGDAVNRAQRYCAAAAAQEVLISPEVYEHVGELLETVRVTVHTKHEGDFLAYRIVYFKESNETVALPIPDAPQ
jgi:adenylate cyclase